MPQVQDKPLVQEAPFLADVTELRRRARERMEEGAVTQGYRGDREAAIRLLNIALATEIVCVLRYKSHYYMARGIHAESVAQEFLQHAADEQGHADQISVRITQLQGEPDLDPKGLAAKAHTQYITGGSLVDMIKEDLIAERVAIDTYAEMARWFGDRDITSRRMIEEILAKEEEHADDMADLLATMDPRKEG